MFKYALDQIKQTDGRMIATSEGMLLTLIDKSFNKTCMLRRPIYGTYNINSLEAHNLRNTPKEIFLKNKRINFNN